MIRYKNLNYYFVLIVLILFQVNSLTAQIIMSPWGTNEKRVTGNFLPIHNIYPYTLMTNQGTGQWQYSCYYIPGQKVTIKFIVNTNTLSPKYIFELMDPRQIEITFGTQGTIYVTNTPAGLMRVTEGTGINGYMSIEFNWEDDPDPPTGISAQVDAREAEIRWSRSLEMDVIGYNVYLSNNFYPYYKKMNRIFITNNRFTVTNLITGSTNYVFITSVDAYTNMPNFESERSSVIQFIADKVINVLFYLQKRREDVSGDLYLGGSVSPLDWTPTQTMTYLYNDNWYFSTVIMKGTSLEYKYNIGQNSSKWEDDLPTSSGNRELVISDSDNDGVMVINDVWGTETVINPPPQAPTNFMAVPGNTNVMLLWRKNREIDLAGYRVYRSMKNTNNFSLIAELLNTNYRDSGLWNNTNYYYRLTATDHEKNESGYSRVILAVPSTNAPPVIPTGLNAAAGDSEVTLRWAQNPEGDIQGYLIWRSEDKYSLYTNISPLLSNTVFTDIFVNNNMTYYYKMQAVDTVGQTNQGYSQIVKAVPSTNTTPSVVTGLELSVTGNRSITIKFNPNSETDIAGYNIYYKKENGVQGGPVSSVSPSYTIINSLENGARYSVWVTALDTLGQEGEASEKITATPVPRITDLLTKPSGTETGAVLLGWTSPEKAGDLGSAKRYIVKYSSAPISFFSEFWEADLFCDTFANGAATLESLKVNNLGTGSPGYYFTIGAIYGLDQGIGLSSSVYQNASQSVNHSSGGTFRKKGERVRIDIPPYTIGEEATAVVIRNYSDISKLNDPVLNEKISTANDKVNNHAALKLINSGTNNVFDITLLNSGGDPVVNPSSFANTVKVSLPFNDADHDLIVDETAGTPDALSVQTLKMFWLNTRINEWAIIDDSTVDLVNNFVMAEIDHLTLFIPISNPPYSDLKHVAVYPNPVYSPSKNNKIVFTKLTAKAKIRIYNIAGELVKDFEKMDQTDKWLWDGLNNNNDPVASGVYIFYIEDGRSEPARGKLAIIR